ncbi:MAG: ABC transporter ATP-binding protein [Thiohalobacterales bacterium]
MHLMIAFFRAYPWQTLVMLLALLFAGVAEGISLSALLPLLNIAIRSDINSDTDAAPAELNEYERLMNDLLQAAGISPSIGIMLVIIVTGGTLKGLLLLVANKQVGYTAAMVATDLRLEMLRAVLRSRWEYFLDQPAGKLANSLATEAHRSSQAFVNGSLMITFFIQALIYGAVALAVSWKATLISLAAGLVIVAISHFLLVRMASKAGKRQTGLLVSLVSRLTDTLQSVKPLKAMAREYLADAVLAMETSRLNRALRRQVYSTTVLSAFQEEMLIIFLAAGMFIMLVQYEMPLATVLVLVVVLGRMLKQLSKVQRQYQRMVIGESAYWSIKQTIEQARETEEQLVEGRAPALLHGIRFDSVHFNYDGCRVLDGLTLEVPAGSLTMLVGPSGAGKTTVIDLLTGLLQPQSGAILIDDISLQELDTRAWRQMIGYVPQETVLLHDSILHNVTLGDPALGEADVERALKEAGAWEFVTAMPEGINSTVGERGGKLSGGQRQRIMIARALVHRPGLLILDEATSSLDPASEAAICHTLEQLRGGLTILAISHQTALVRVADHVYHLENGKARAVESSTVLFASNNQRWK